MRPRALLVTCASIAALLVPSRAPAAPAGTTDATLGPLISGTSSYVDGTYVWTDYAYDDKGATYPAGQTNAADLIQLQLTPYGVAGLQVRAVLETLIDADAPMLILAIDSDNDPSTGAQLLPWAALDLKGALGFDRIISVAAGRATLQAWDGEEFKEDGDEPANVDEATNTLEAAIPDALLVGSGSSFRVLAFSSLAKNPKVYDLAVVGGESPSGFQSTRQSQVIAGQLDASNAIATVDLDKMRAGTTELADATTPGFHTFLYHSNLNLPEGIPAWNLQGPAGAQLPLGNFYAGPYQPYIVWLPDRPLPPHPPLVVYMHGLQGTHTSNVNTLGAGKIDPDAVVVMPLGRGEDSFYEREGEQDILDVTDDAIARFNVDEDRIVLSGISMGGFGSFRIAILRPDRWSAIVPLIGTANSAQFYAGALPPGVLGTVFSPNAFPSGAGEMMENLRHVPIRMVNGQVDPIVNNAFVMADTARLLSLGYDFTSWVLLRRQHEVVPEITGCVFDQALQFHRDRNPSHVVFSSEPAMKVSDPQSGLDLRYDTAYWVNNVEARANPIFEKASVDITSDGLGARAESSSLSEAIGENFDQGADLCGGASSAQTQDAWREVGQGMLEGPPQFANQLHATVANLSSVTIDLARAGINVKKKITIQASGDGISTLRLIGPWLGPVNVSTGTADHHESPVDGVIEITDNLLRGKTFTITPA